ncbi:MAG: hypothetical protein R3A44_39140 [Caldilineaceae bacterium]
MSTATVILITAMRMTNMAMVTMLPALIQRADGVLNPEGAQDMRNMGGLLERMPHGLDICDGGLALSGFPLVTAASGLRMRFFRLPGMAETALFLDAGAWLSPAPYVRQIGMTWEPAYDHGRTYPESVPTMTWPLLPDCTACDFPGLVWHSGLAGHPNWLESFLEPHIEHLHFHVAHHILALCR